MRLRIEIARLSRHRGRGQGEGENERSSASHDRLKSNSRTTETPMVPAQTGFRVRKIPGRDGLFGYVPRSSRSRADRSLASASLATETTSGLPTNPMAGNGAIAATVDVPGSRS